MIYNEEEAIEETKEPEKKIDVDPEALAMLSMLVTEEDLNIFKQFIANLKAGVVEMDQPIVLKTSFDDKNKRAEFHGLFKTKIPEYISDTIVEGDNRNMAG
jgi:broad-specificity NMP kinase